MMSICLNLNRCICPLIPQNKLLCIIYSECHKIMKKDTYRWKIVIHINSQVPQKKQDDKINTRWLACMWLLSTSFFFISALFEPSRSIRLRFGAGKRPWQWQFFRPMAGRGLWKIMTEEEDAPVIYYKKCKTIFFIRKKSPTWFW